MADEQPEKLVLTEEDIQILKSTAANLVVNGGNVSGAFKAGEGVVHELARTMDWLNRQAPSFASPST